MAYVLADSIISPLGNTSEENYLSVKAGRSGIRAYASGTLGIPTGFTASLLFSDFEELAYESAKQALLASGIEVAKSKVVFILSSTKGAIEKNIGLSDSANRIALRLGIKEKPIVVCNACISGLSALILGSRLIEQGCCDHAVVCGCDTPARFVISGFQSLKALSSEPCRPFDMERFGLNLGEASATIVLGKEKAPWQIGHGFVKNDAFHISAPSKTAEGLFLALKETLSYKDDADELAFINAHGTATLFNDQMESIAIQRAGLSEIPVNALKGYLGHTLGAAGILEMVLSMKAVDDHTVLGTLGFEELGVSGKVKLSTKNIPTENHSFIKMLSGFGGCNAAMLAVKDTSTIGGTKKGRVGEIHKTHTVRITPTEVIADGRSWALPPEQTGKGLLTYLYKQSVGDYPKYYKMDSLSRLGFIASELLLKAENEPTENSEATSRAIVLFNHSSSIISDRKYLASIEDKDEYFPSPSVFVYTLPNIVTGEIAIRNGYHGETSFYILPSKDEEQMEQILQTAFLDAETKSVLSGWIDYEDDEHFEADLSLYVSR